ncbi:MAG TPA: hypothetical protein VII23_03270 [Terriglobales bacterium]
MRPQTAMVYPTTVMNAAPKPEPILNTIHLLSAVLCADCEVISDSTGDVCAVCGSHSLISLSRVLGGSVGEARATIVATDEQQARHGFTLFVNPSASTLSQPSRRWSKPQRLEK